MSHPRNGTTNKSPKQPTSPVSTRPKKWYHKLKPKATNGTCVNTWRSGRDHHIRNLRRHLVRPFRQHAIRDQDKRNVHDVKSRAACLSQELAAEISRGAWARIRLISSTQTSPAKKTILCANINVRVAIRLCACLAARMRSPETVSNHLPPFLSHRTSTLRNMRSSRTGAVLRVPHVHVHLNLTHGVQQHSVRLPQKLTLPSVNLRFVQEHVATFHCVVTCLKVKFRHHFTRALRYLCDDVSSWSPDQTGKKPHKITTSNGVAQLHNGKQAHA